MNQCGGLQRVIRALVHHVAPGDAAELGIDHRRKAIESSRITRAPGPEQAGNFH